MNQTMPFPGFAHLFELCDPIGRRPYRGTFDPHDYAVALSRREGQGTPTCVRVTWAMGGQFPDDVIWTTSSHPLIVHERLVEILAKE